VTAKEQPNTVNKMDFEVTALSSSLDFTMDKYNNSSRNISAVVFVPVIPSLVNECLEIFYN
jgi:hypothetical protein